MAIRCSLNLTTLLSKYVAVLPTKVTSYDSNDVRGIDIMRMIT